jgi:hypothetical protein
MSGQLDFNSDAYRSIETLLCGLLRFAHRVTLLGFVSSVRERAKAKNKDEFVDYHKQIELKVSRTAPGVQEKLNKILNDTSTAVVVYMSLSSVFFLAFAIVFFICRGLGIVRDGAESQISSIMESEVYREESRPTQFA